MDYEPGYNPNFADDKPDKGSLFSDGWTLYDWQIWFYANVQKYGHNTAVAKFVREWNDTSFFSVFEWTLYSFAKYDRDFHAFLQKEQIPLSNIFADTVTGAGDVVESGIDTVKGIGDTASNTATVLKYALPAALVIVGLIVLIQAQKTIKSA